MNECDRPAPGPTATSSNGGDKPATPEHERIGAIWAHPEIDFNDGEGPRRKYFVLLSECENSTDQFVTVFTTSKGEARYKGHVDPSPCGCPRFQCYRLGPKDCPCFPIKTWLQYDNMNDLSLSVLQEEHAKNKIEFLCRMNENQIRSILNCAAKSQDIRQYRQARMKRAYESMPKSAPQKKK